MFHKFNKHVPFYADFINLLDNYEMSTGVSETVTSEELKENKLFIDAIVETDVMKVQRFYHMETSFNTNLKTNIPTQVFYELGLLVSLERI